VRLVEVDAAGRAAALKGSVDGLVAAPGWPHEDSEPGMSFLESGGLVFVVVDDDGRIIGECGTKAPPSADGTVEIGYGLAAPSRGRGLGREMVGTLVSWLAAQPEVRAIEAEVHIGNPPSYRLLERLGFTGSEADLHGYRRYRLTTVGHPEQLSPNISLVRPRNVIFTRLTY
jgi:GNAT superfamily N-acetyltransferase